MKRIALILILLGSLKGQSQELYIPYFTGISTLTLDATTDTVEVSGTVVANLDTFDVFADTLRIHIAVRDALNQAQVMGQVELGHQTIDNLDSITIPLIKIDIVNSYFEDGNNTVVIWPACPGIHTYDSLEFVVQYNSINELIDKDINVTVGPNPTDTRLFLGDPDNLVKQVRFRTSDGKLVGVASTNAMLDLNLSNGVYIIELETADRKVYTRKLIVQR